MYKINCRCSLLKFILFVDFILVFAFVVIIGLIYFRPSFMYPDVEMSINFLGKTRMEVWNTVVDWEKKFGSGDKLLISADIDINKIATDSTKRYSDFPFEYWFDKNEPESQENKSELNYLLKEEISPRLRKGRRWLVFRKYSMFLYAYPFASGLALEFDENGIVKKQYPFYLDRKKYKE